MNIFENFLGFVIRRPIGVLLTLLAFLFFSVIALFQLPVSLLPAADIPRLQVRVQYPAGSPEVLENSVLKPLREQLQVLNGLEDLRSRAEAGQGGVKLYFQHGTNMQLSYLEANEIVDRLMPSFPAAIDRPQVLRLSASDIPICRLQIIPKIQDNFLEASELTQRVLRKRLEALPGIALIDLHGHDERIIELELKQSVLESIQLKSDIVFASIREANRDLGSLIVRDGSYRFRVRLATRLRDVADIEALPVRLPSGKVLKISDIARVVTKSAERLGGHYFMNDSLGVQRGLVLTLHKQEDARMTELMPEVYEVIKELKKDFPQFHFFITQDQSELLTVSIENLQQALLYGGVFAFAVLFFFMGNWRNPLIIGLSIPVSLLLSFPILLATDTSLNVITLSGLALGLGMLIDNSIIVLDNLGRLVKESDNLAKSTIHAVLEVMPPLVSSALTTLSVFVPLVFLKGLAGVLFTEQAIAIAAVLGCSLLVAYLFIPTLYFILISQKKNSLQALEEPRFFRVLFGGYETLYAGVWKKKKWVFFGLICVVPLALFSLYFFKKQAIPNLEKKGFSLQIDWEEPLSASANAARVRNLFAALPTNLLSMAEADYGILQFNLQKETQRPTTASCYVEAKSASEVIALEESITNYFTKHFPCATFKTTPAQNAFEQLFENDEPALHFRLRPPPSQEVIAVDKLAPLPKGLMLDEGFQEQPATQLRVLHERLALRGISEAELLIKLEQVFGTPQFTQLQNYGWLIPIQLAKSQGNPETLLAQHSLYAQDGKRYPLREFVRLSTVQTYEAIVADRLGRYQAIISKKSDYVFEKINFIQNFSKSSKGLVQISGAYFNAQENFTSFLQIFVFALVLLYFILAVQFEHLLFPFIVIFTVPLGVGGSLLMLYTAGESLNFMAIIGIVIMAGIMVNDAILKLATIQQLRQKIPLAEALQEAGRRRFKPIVMTSLTTILAVLPVLWSSGLGADLQRPLVLSVLGGLSVGTFTALYFVPLAVYFLKNRFF